MLCSRRADTVRTAADRHILDRRDRLLPGIHHLQFLHSALFEFAAHDLRQRADRRLIDVRHLKHCRIQLVAGAHAADDRRSCLLRLHDQRNLCRHSIDCIHDIRIAGKIELVLCLWQIEALVHLHLAVRVDVENAVTHDLRLIFSHGAARCDDLTVQIGEADLIIVDQIDGSHTASHQRLYGVASHTTNTKNSDPRTREPLHSLFS